MDQRAGAPSDKALTMPPHMPTQWVPPSRPTRKRARKPESGTGGKERAMGEGRDSNPGPSPFPSNHLRVARALPIGPQVAVENHGDDAHQHAPRRQDRDPFRLDLEQAG